MPLRKESSKDVILGKPIKKLKVLTDAASMNRAHDFTDKLNDVFANIGGDIFLSAVGDSAAVKNPE